MILYVFYQPFAFSFSRAAHTFHATQSTHKKYQTYVAKLNPALS